MAWRLCSTSVHEHSHISVALQVAVYTCCFFQGNASKASSPPKNVPAPWWDCRAPVESLLTLAECRCCARPLRRLCTFCPEHCVCPRCRAACSPPLTSWCDLCLTAQAWLPSLGRPVPQAQHQAWTCKELCVLGQTLVSRI